MNTQTKYVVQHPNYEEYLRLLPKPIITYNYDEMWNEVEKVYTHLWVKDATKATQFDSYEDASLNSTSPLCSVFSIANGILKDRYAYKTTLISIPIN